MGIFQDIRSAIATRIFGDIIQEQVQAAAVKVRVDDSPGWDSLSAGPADRPWSERQSDLTDALDAWRKNFFIRHIVTLTRAYVVGGGIAITSKDPTVDKFIQAFCTHPKNHLATRLGEMCNELTRSGELFPVLFTNRADGMSYLRFVPATRIHEIETDPDDYETELGYSQITTGESKHWIGPDHKSAFKRTRGGPGGRLQPLMLHFAVNRPIGATRGEGDLGPILPWAKRYSEWLKDRVRLNRVRTRQAILDVEIADDTLVEEKRQQLRTSNPLEHGIYVHGPGEKLTLHSLKIEASDAEDDGKALRLAIATGSNTALHYFGEGEGTNYATAKEMGEPTARFYTERQEEIEGFLKDLIAAAYHRQAAALGQELPPNFDLQLITNVGEVARADNESLAKAAKTIVEALVLMRHAGWLDDQTAVKMAFKFAGEPLGEEEVKRILQTTKAKAKEQPDEE